MRGRAMPKILALDVPGRVHLSLFDLTGNGYRRHGGLGFSIQSGYRCLASSSRKAIVLDRRPQSQGNEEQAAALTDLIDRVAKAEGIPAIQFEILEGFSVHQGLGSGTALRLAATEALLTLGDRVFTSERLIGLSGRGGVSGVGVNSYFTGGLVVDAGVRAMSSEAFKSSDDFEHVSVQPLRLLRAEMPAWEVGVCLPLADGQIDIERERSFFLKEAGFGSPLDCGAIAYEAFLGVLPAVLESDFEAFVLSLDALQKTRWKAKEWDIHDGRFDAVQQLIRQRGGKGVALSSLGPALIYFLHDASDSATWSHSGFRFLTTQANNTGRRIEHV
jgi:beta-ribofuranosylaminobenzene 5'-phosphate synthase